MWVDSNSSCYIVRVLFPLCRTRSTFAWTTATIVHLTYLMVLVPAWKFVAGDRRTASPCLFAVVHVQSPCSMYYYVVDLIVVMDMGTTVLFLMGR